MEKKVSGKAVIKAGDSLVSDDIFLPEHDEEFRAAMSVLSYWRFLHEEPMNKAHDLLERICLKADKDVILAKRLKRHVSIVGKLRRFQEQNMKLKNMQDIGGCRAILKSEKKLRKVLRELKQQSAFRGSNGVFRVKDYINSPKTDGYRGVHIIGKFSDKDGGIRNIEVQLRTQIQHYWATALEIIDIFTGQALKSNQGEIKWEAFFIRISELFALMENIHMFDSLPFEEKLRTFRSLYLNNRRIQQSCDQAQELELLLNVSRKLDAYSGSLQVIDERLDELSNYDGYILIIIDLITLTLSTEMFSQSDSEKAEQRFIAKETESANNSNMVVSLVSAKSLGGIKAAYPNYFADSTEFMNLLNVITAMDLSGLKMDYLLSKMASKLAIP